MQTRLRSCLPPASVAALFGVMLAAPVPAQDAARGAQKSEQCIACHGPGGLSANPTFPHLAGQHAAYLQVQLENFRSGDRVHPLMTPVAQALSDQDMADLAAYYSSIGPLADAR